jgi:hypothetical protein
MVKKVLRTCENCKAENCYLKKNVCLLCKNKDKIKNLIRYMNEKDQDNFYIFKGIKPNKNICEIVDKKTYNEKQKQNYIKKNNLCWSDACQEYQQPTEFNIRKNYIINNLI